MTQLRDIRSVSLKQLHSGSVLFALLCFSLMLMQIGCVKPMGQHPCEVNECFGQDIWQESIDRIAAHNFPEEHFYGKVYSDLLNNAWTTDDNDVNISEDMLTRLAHMGDAYVLSVSAHEIAHIRSHHYSRKASLSQFSSVGSPSEGPFSYRTKKHKAKLSRKHELEADKLAVQYMQKAGYQAEDYLNFLKWMKSNMKDAPQSDLATHPPIRERIKRIEKLISYANTVSEKKGPVINNPALSKMNQHKLHPESGTQPRSGLDIKP